jgi:hypothetical protein
MQYIPGKEDKDVYKPIEEFPVYYNRTFSVTVFHIISSSRSRNFMYFILRESYTSLYLGRKVTCCGAILSMYPSLT